MISFLSFDTRWIYISESQPSSFHNLNSAGTIDFFLRVYVYWLLLIHCVLSWDFGKESCYSMDCKSLFTAKKCLRPIQKQGASMNGYTVWIFSFYPIFLQMIFMLKKCNAWLRFYHCMDISFYPIFFSWFLWWKNAIPRIEFLLQWIIARVKHV